MSETVTVLRWVSRRLAGLARRLRDGGEDYRALYLEALELGRRADLMEQRPDVGLATGGRDVTCETCRWWDPDRATRTGVGLCRRLPPPLSGMDVLELDERGRIRLSYNAVAWPESGRGDWCGEWAAKETP